MKMNPPTMLTVIIAVVLVLVGIVLEIIGQPLIAFLCAAASSVLMIAGIFVKGL